MVLPHRMIKNGWSPWHFAGALVMVIFGLAMTWPAWNDIYHRAITLGQARYIMLVPVVAGWLVWVRRRRLLHCRPHGYWIGLCLIAGGGFSYAFATQIEMAGGLDVSWFDGGWVLAWHLGAVLMTVGCGLTLLGVGVVKRFLPAIVVLVFLVPLPPMLCRPIEMPVQLLTAELTVTLYGWLGIPAAIDGDVLMINGIRVAVSQVCSGLPMVLDLFLVSWAFVFSTPLRESVRLIILLLSPVSAMLCGALGLMATLWVYGQGVSPQTAALLHEVGGWGMLLLAFLILAATMKALVWASVPVRPYTLAYDYY